MFIIGAPRSGTSFVSEAFSCHEDLGWVPIYMNRYPARTCFAVLNRLLDLPFVGPHLRGQKKQRKGLLALVRHLLPYSAESYPFWEYHCGPKMLHEFLADARASDQERRSARLGVAEVLRMSGKPRFFAKLTGPPRISYLASIFPDALFLHLVRDPRAVVASLLSVGFWRQGGGFEKPWWQGGLTEADLDEWQKSGKAPEVLAAVQWRAILAHAQHEGTTLGPTQYRELRYEDFVKRPLELLDELFGFCDLPPSTRSTDNLRRAGLRPGLNSKYLKILTPEQISRVENVTRETAESRGYEIS